MIFEFKPKAKGEPDKRIREQVDCPDLAQSSTFWQLSVLKELRFDWSLKVKPGVLMMTFLSVELLYLWIENLKKKFCPVKNPKEAETRHIREVVCHLHPTKQ